MGFLQATIQDSLSRLIVFAQDLPAAQDPPAATNSNQTDFTSMLVPIGMIVVLFYFMILRPERRKKQDLNSMVANLKKNDRVVTIGGIYGTVVTAAKDSDELTIRVDESTNTKLTQMGLYLPLKLDTTHLPLLLH